MSSAISRPTFDVATLSFRNPMPGDRSAIDADIRSIVDKPEIYEGMDDTVINIYRFVLGDKTIEFQLRRNSSIALGEKGLQYGQCVKLLKAANLLEKHVHGNEYERVYFITGCEHLPASYWRTWQTIEAAAWRLYRETIDRACLDVLAGVMKEKCDIGEICGGDGSLAKQIFDAQGAKIRSYRLIDLNTANQKEKRVEVIEGDITNASAKIYTTTYDIIIAMGALAHHILASREVALATLKLIVAVLKPGGFFLMSSHSPSLIDSKDLKEAGLTVSNTIYPHGKLPYVPFYIGKK